MEKNELTTRSHDETKSDDSATLLSYDREDKNIGSIVLGALGSALWELAREAWSLATDSSRVNIKDLVDFQSFLFSTSKGSQKILESSLENAGKLPKLIDQAERNSNPKLARDYRNQLADTYKQMSITVSQEAYRFEARHPGQADYAKRFATHLLNISEKVRTPGSSVPTFDVRDLRRSQNGLGQNNLVANPALGDNIQANIAAFNSLSEVRNPSEAKTSVKQLVTSPTNNADLDKALAILNGMKKDNSESADKQSTTPEPVAVGSGKDSGMGL
jgi:hypothetical protein